MPQKSTIFSGFFVSKILAKNFQKSPNLVTLLNNPPSRITAYSNLCLIRSKHECIILLRRSKIRAKMRKREFYFSWRKMIPCASRNNFAYKTFFVKFLKQENISILLRIVFWSLHLDTRLSVYLLQTYLFLSLSLSFCLISSFFFNFVNAFVASCTRLFTASFLLYISPLSIRL